MTRVAAIAALVVLAGACAAPRPPAPPTPGLDWFFQVDGETGKLAYGTPESDEVLLSLECRKGADQVLLSRPAATGAPPEIVLSAEGVETTRLTATATPSQTHDGVDLDATLPVTAPVLSGFHKGGWLGVLVGNETRRYAAQPAGQAVDRFLAWCRAESSAAGTV